MCKTPFLHIGLLFAFLLNIFGPMPLAEAQLPEPGVLVRLSPPLNPPMLKGIKVHPDDPFRFDFILDQGDGSHGVLDAEASQLVEYFLASITIPEQDLWVNLSPYEKDRIIPESFGQTAMGRDLLAEDYMLKQITASLIYPGDAVGKKFWKRVYEEAASRFGTTNIPVNTFNKVWIVPEKAVVYENVKAATAYVVEAKLKVMLEEDYLALEKNQGQTNNPLKLKAPRGNRLAANELGSQIVREIVIPELNREVNEDKNFAQLRQVYHSLILATWYKKKIKDSILAQVYADKNKVAGVGYRQSVILSAANDLGTADDPSSMNDTQLIYRRYLQAFKKGAYNYIKEEVDPITQQMIPRKYFAGGFFGAMIDHAMTVTDEDAVGKSLRPSTTLDGYGGGEVSEFIRDNLIPVFEDKIIASHGNISNAIRATFSTLNTMTRHYIAGSTLSLVFIPRLEMKIYYGVLGDSPLSFITEDGDPVMAPMHNLDDFYNRAHSNNNNDDIVAISNKINRKGAGISGIEAVGMWVLGEDGKKRWLRVTRSLGDKAFEGVVIRKPDIGVIDRDESKIRSILLASDGILEESNSIASLRELSRKIQHGEVTADDIVNKSGDDDNKTALIWHPALKVQGQKPADRAMAASERLGISPANPRDGDARVSEIINDTQQAEAVINNWFQNASPAGRRFTRDQWFNVLHWGKKLYFSYLGASADPKAMSLFLLGNEHEIIADLRNLPGAEADKQKIGDILNGLVGKEFFYGAITESDGSIRGGGSLLVNEMVNKFGSDHDFFAYIGYKGSRGQEGALDYSAKFTAMGFQRVGSSDIYFRKADAAMTGKSLLVSKGPVIQRPLPTGGIDLSSDKALQVKSDGQGGIQFKIDGARLAALQKAPGFVPVIINIQLLNDLQNFLGIG